ncbi:MAG TPA: YceI family protein [Ferruginibacter sp.]|nr:YceI family protein [Ferruginibacter sp.]HPH92104.1 YceI family protein [Ferruginibacter sp.]
MNKCFRILTFAGCFFVLVAAAPVTVYKVNKGSIAFNSDAPMELIKASSNELAGLFDASTKKFAFRVKVSSFEGFNTALQKEHFNENYMESNSFPYASFEGKVIEDIDYSKPGVYNVRAKGNFTVHGVSQERIIKVEITAKPQTVSVRSSFTVLLADHNITIPKVVHEKLASEIKVDIKAELATQ